MPPRRSTSPPPPPNVPATAPGKPAFDQTVDQLVARGIVPPEKRDELRKYLAALKGLQDIFHNDGRRPPSSRNLTGELHDAVRRTISIANALNDENRVLNDWLGPNAMDHVEELLRGNPDRLERVRTLYVGAQSGVQANARAIDDLEDLLKSIEHTATKSRTLVDALSDLRRELTQ